MALTPDEAANSLRQATDVQKHSREIYGYSLSAPYFFVWGLVWMAGYAASAFAAPQARLIWPVLLLAGFAATAAINQSQKKIAARPNGRIWAMLGVVYAFSFAIFAIFRPTSELQLGAYWPLLVAAIYAGMGLWLGFRYVVIAVLLAAATLGGYFFLREYFFVWMAIVGSGSLILTGLWMRRA